MPKLRRRVVMAAALVVLVLAGAIFLARLQGQRERDDQRAWEELQTYASTQGPTMAGELLRAGPCLFSSDEERSGDAALESALQASTMAGFAERGNQAAALLRSQGWQTDGRSTAASETYFTGKRVFGQRVVFVAVESDSAADLEMDLAEYRVRYLLDVKAC